MLIISCQKCGETKVITGSPDKNGGTRVVWTCDHCGAGQILEIVIGKNTRKGDINNVVKGLAFGKYPAMKSSLLQAPDIFRDEML